MNKLNYKISYNTIIKNYKYNKYNNKYNNLNTIYNDKE